MLTRRFVLAAGAVAAASAAVARIPPGPPTAAPAPTAPPPPPKVAWVVGTPGEYDWEVVRAPTRERALEIWLEDSGWEPECEVECPPGEDPETWEPETLTQCVCGKCLMPDVEADRVTAFDSIRNPTPGDWIRANIGHTCSRCREEASPGDGAIAIGDDCICPHCQTREEKAAANEERERLREERREARARAVSPIPGFQIPGAITAPPGAGLSQPPSLGTSAGQVPEITYAPAVEASFEEPEAAYAEEAPEAG